MCCFFVFWSRVLEVDGIFSDIKFAYLKIMVKKNKKKRTNKTIFKEIQPT